MINTLNKEQWKDYPLTFEYTTDHYFDFEQSSCNDAIAFNIVKKPFKTTLNKKFVNKLFPDYYENSEGYGIIEGDTLIGVIALSKEDWNNRLRITELLVCPKLRKQGIGSKLMNIAKTRAKELNCRSIILETQSCNEKAINFYFSQGFSLVGFDTNCYSNNDIEKR